jgi:hypothetical protein
MTTDEEHLNLLATFHCVVAGLGALSACVPFIHVSIGVLIVTRPEFMNGGRGSPPPEWLGYLFIALGGLFVLFGWVAAICTFISGRYLAMRKSRMFSFVVAAALCMFMPFGTVLGIFTIVVLSKESVQRLYSSPIR